MYRLQQRTRGVQCRGSYFGQNLYKFKGYDTEIRKFSDKVGMLLSIADETERYRREGVVNPPVVM